MKGKRSIKCGIWFCERPHYAKGLCHAHWLAQRRYGTPLGRHTREINVLQNRITDLENQLAKALMLIDWLMVTYGAKVDSKN